MSMKRTTSEASSSSNSTTAESKGPRVDDFALSKREKLVLHDRYDSHFAPVVSSFFLIELL